jgi:hypothetical protein
MQNSEYFLCVYSAKGKKESNTTRSCILDVFYPSQIIAEGGS